MTTHDPAPLLELLAIGDRPCLARCRIWGEGDKYGIHHPRGGAGYVPRNVCGREFRAQTPAVTVCDACAVRITEADAKHERAEFERVRGLAAARPERGTGSRWGARREP